jgi:hypothetical protein
MFASGGHVGVWAGFERPALRALARSIGENGMRRSHKKYCVTFRTGYCRFFVPLLFKLDFVHNPRLASGRSGSGFLPGVEHPV